MKTSGGSHGNLTRAIKGTLGLKWLLRKSQTLASRPAGDSCQLGAPAPQPSVCGCSWPWGRTLCLCSLNSREDGGWLLCPQIVVPTAANTAEHAACGWVLRIISLSKMRVPSLSPHPEAQMRTTEEGKRSLSCRPSGAGDLHLPKHPPLFTKLRTHGSSGIWANYLS